MFCDTSAEAATAAPHTDEVEETPDPVHTKSALEIAAGQAKKKWKIPTQVEKGFEIPIAITDASVVPELGNFKRLAMDVVVNAVWVALWWAKEEKNRDAESALKNLILTWPIDFVWIKGDTPDAVSESIVGWSVNVGARAERLRSEAGMVKST